MIFNRGANSKRAFGGNDFALAHCLDRGVPLNLAAQGYHLARAQAQASMPERGHLMRHPALTETALGVERLRGDRVSMRRALDDAIPINERSGRSLGQSPLATEFRFATGRWVKRSPRAKF